MEFVGNNKHNTNNNIASRIDPQLETKLKRGPLIGSKNNLVDGLTDR